MTDVQYPAEKSKPQPSRKRRILRRKRRILRRALKYTAATFAILAIAYGALCIWYYRQTPKLTRNYAAELNAETLKVPPEKRAWTHYRRALEALELREVNEYADQPGDKDWPTTVAYVKRNAAAIQMLREASKIRPMGIILQDGRDPADVQWQLRHQQITADNAEIARPSTENPSLAFLPFEFLSADVNIARALLTDARLAATEGDAARTKANFDALLNLAEQAGEGPFFITKLVASVIAGMAISEFNEILSESPDAFDDVSLTSLTERFQSILDAKTFKVDVASERLDVADHLQRNYTDDGSENGHFIFIADTYKTRGEPEEEEFSDRLKRYWDHFRAPIWSFFVMPSRRELQQATETYFDDANRALSQNSWQSFDDVDFEDKSPLLTALYTWDGDSMWEESGHIRSVMDVSARLNQEIGGALVAIALTRHYRAKNRYPSSLAELVPSLLQQVPNDQFNGKPLLYKLIDGQPTVYSVGADGDDDGGYPSDDSLDPFHTGVQNFTNEKPPDGDWILFPPYKEPPLNDDFKDDANEEAIAEMPEDETEDPNAPDNEQVEPNDDVKANDNQPDS